MMLPSTCALTASGLITSPQSCAQTTRSTWIAPRSRSTATSIGHLHPDCDKALVVLVMHVGEAPPARETRARGRARRRATLPIHHRGRPLHDLDPARVGELRQPERDWVLPRGGGELVGETLDRERVGDLSRRADVGRAQWGVLEPVYDHVQAVHRIRRVAVL